MRVLAYQYECRQSTWRGARTEARRHYERPNMKGLYAGPRWRLPMSENEEKTFTFRETFRAQSKYPPSVWDVIYKRAAWDCNVSREHTIGLVKALLDQAGMSLADNEEIEALIEERLP